MNRDEDRNYRSTGSRRMLTATLRGRPAILAAPGRFSTVSAGNEGLVRQRARLGSMVADLSASFVGLPVHRIDAAVQLGLRQTVESLGFDQGAFYQRTGDGLTIAYSWPVKNFEATLEPGQADNLTWLADRLCRKGLLVFSGTEAASDEICREALVRLGLRWAVFVGVKTRGSLLGALMLGSSREQAAWSGDMEPLLQILSTVFAEALARKQYEERLLESDQLSHDMLGALESHIVLVDREGSVIAVSKGRRFDAEGGAPFLCDVSPGVNYFDTCRSAVENGLDSADVLLQEIGGVVKGSRKNFEMEYEYLSASGQKFFQVSVTPRIEPGGGAVISHIETTERRRAQTNLRELSGKTITSLEEERRRIARELHDEVSQRLALMGIELEQIMQALPENHNIRRRLRDLWGHNQETSLEVRRLSHNLHSSKLEYLGLVAAVKSLCNDLSNHQGLRIRFKHADVPSSIPKDVALCVYRVVQESLCNVIKHSGAEAAEVALSGGDREVNLSISDEGCGFDLDKIKAKAGIGLIGIRERLQLIGGEASIESQPSHGTRIVARVPLREQGRDTNVSRGATNSD